MIVRSGLIFGTILWVAATAVFVPFGHFVFGPDNRIPAALAAGLIIVATFAGVYWFALRVLRRSGAAQPDAGAQLGVFACLPGLVLDGSLYAFNAGQYPGLDGSASGTMSAGLLLAYAAALLAAFAAGRAPRAAAGRQATG